MQYQSHVAENHALLHRKLVFQLTVTGHATPASKKQASELPGDCFIATEGKDDITAVEDISGLSGFSAAADNSTGDSIFHVLLKGGSSNLGSVGKVYKASLVDRGGSATSVAVTPLGASEGLTAGGNIALQIAGTGLNLASENADLVLEVDFKLSE